MSIEHRIKSETLSFELRPHDITGICSVAAVRVHRSLAMAQEGSGAAGQQSEDEDAGGVGFMLATAVYDFEAEHESELSLSSGDIVRVITQEAGEGWWAGIREDGQKGLFPGDFVELLLLDSDDEGLADDDDDDNDGGGREDDDVADRDRLASVSSLPPPPPPPSSITSSMTSSMMSSLASSSMMPSTLSTVRDDEEEEADVVSVTLPPPPQSFIVNDDDDDSGADRSTTVPIATAEAAPLPPPPAMPSAKAPPPPRPKPAARQSTKKKPSVEQPAPPSPSQAKGNNTASSSPSSSTPPLSSQTSSENTEHNGAAAPKQQDGGKGSSRKKAPPPPKPVAIPYEVVLIPDDKDEAVQIATTTTTTASSSTMATSKTVPAVAVAMATSTTTTTTATGVRNTRLSSLPQQNTTLDAVTARKLLASGQAPCIVGGPRWFSETTPPVVRIVDACRESKLNGVKQFIVYVIHSYANMPTTDSSAPQAVVTRRYKHFLWLHTTLTDLFPGVVVPPLPVKQLTGRFNDAFILDRQEQLERFLNRLARNPLVRVSHAFTHFLTATTFADWKQGKQNVRRSIAYSRPTKAKESPQYFFSISLPVNNVPFDRVLVVENFAVFSKLLRRNTSALHSVSSTSKEAYEELGSSYERLGAALKHFASGRSASSERRSVMSGGSSTDSRKSPSIRHRHRVNPAPDSEAASAHTSSTHATDSPTPQPPTSSPGVTKASTSKTTGEKTPKTSKFFVAVDNASGEEPTSSPQGNKASSAGASSSSDKSRKPAPPPPARPTRPPPAGGVALSQPKPKPRLKAQGSSEEAQENSPQSVRKTAAAAADGDSVDRHAAAAATAGIGNHSNGDSPLLSTKMVTSVEYVASEEVENWSWRKTCPRFPHLMGRLHGVGSGLIKLGEAIADAENSPSAESDLSSQSLADGLKEYIGLLQSVPNLVRYHEEAVDQLNSAKASSTREVVAQATRHADICSNVVLAEMDLFYDSLITDMQAMISGHLRHKMHLHRMMADSYEKMLDMFEGERRGT
eukprot:scpid58419/ scgid10380/ Sorting nexin-33; SH3 and PX domain-containing protein 3